jgi:UDP-N-acetylmuramate--alanine ligase
VSGGGSSYRAVLRGRDLGLVRLQVAGEHLARNSAAALLAGIGLGLPEDLLVEGLGGYTGVRRRMELKGTAGGVRVYDDYAHHPTEVRAQLVAARTTTWVTTRRTSRGRHGSSSPAPSGRATPSSPPPGPSACRW